MNEYSIPAAKTYYKGFEFLSTTEAQWAVFFDALGVRYEYEPERFIIPGGTYRPDFYIPAWNCFIEIKPESFADYEPCRLLSQSGKPVYLISGRPFMDDNGKTAYSVTEYTHGALNEIDAQYFTAPEAQKESYFAECRKCSGISLVIAYNEFEACRIIDLGKHTKACRESDKLPYNTSLLAAHRAAQQAHFERTR